MQTIRVRRICSRICMAIGLTPLSARLLPSTPTFRGTTREKKISLDATQEAKETRALEKMRLAVDMHEIFERVSCIVTIGGWELGIRIYIVSTLYIHHGSGGGGEDKRASAILC